MIRMKTQHILTLLLILIIAAIFRFTGINWDDNAHLHPDERFLTMVATSIDWPGSIPQYFDTDRSPLNPQNRGHSFYVYGTYPVYITKAVAGLLGKDTYNGITLTGRVLSGIADMITVLTVFLIGRYMAQRLFGKKDTAVIAGLIASFCYASSVLAMQLSHFFTVDPYVTLFTTLALWQIIRGKFGMVSGIITGMAIGAKVSAATILLPAVAAYGTYWLRIRTKGNRAIVRYTVSGFLFLIATAMTVRIVYPYQFDGLSLNPKILANWRQLASFNTPATNFPPGIQWIGVPSWQPVWDIIMTGLGAPLGLFSVLAVVYYLTRITRLFVASRFRDVTKHAGIMLLLFWILLILGYQSVQFTKAMRYFWIIYPPLCVLAGLLSVEIATHAAGKRPLKRAATFLWIPFLLLILIWPMAYLRIYTVPTTRIAATEWIYHNIPPGSVIAWESWDDPLPFARNGKTPGMYKTHALPVFDPERPEKWDTISSILRESDYVILSSNRGYGAIGRAKHRFPQTYGYYQGLFDGSLGFRITAQFMSRPALPVPGIRQCYQLPGFKYGHVSASAASCNTFGISFIDDYTDETFTVYDHPVVTVFKKTYSASYSDILPR